MIFKSRKLIEQLTKKNESLTTENEMLRKKLQTANTKQAELERELFNAREDVGLNDYLYESQISTYQEILQKITAGEWVALTNEAGREEAIQHSKLVKKAYKKIQSTIESAETNTGLCYDVISDMYHDMYYYVVDEEEKAASMGFLMVDRLSVEEMENVCKELSDTLIERAIIHEESMIAQFTNRCS